MSGLHEIQRPPTRPRRYVAPAELDEALAVLAEHGPSARAVAGGTDLLVELDRGQRGGVEVLVDLGRITGLDEIRVERPAGSDRDRVVLGALVTHNRVVRSAECRSLVAPLVQACREVGSPALRNRATVAGNVVTASPANDTLSPLMVLGTECVIASVRGTRTVPLHAFVTGFRSTVLEPDELLVELRVPVLGPDDRGVFVKAGLRSAQAISVVHLAAVVTVQGDVVTSASLALGSVAPTVVTVPGVAGALVGRPAGDPGAVAAAVDAAVAVAAPIDDLRADAGYRRHLVGVMTRRALEYLADPTGAPTGPDVCLWSSGHHGRFPTGTGHALSLERGDAVTARIDGREVTAPWRGDTLLDWLRDDVGVDAPKEGCAEGECGACTVQLDGAAVLACLVPAGRTHGAEITTAAGLGGSGALHPVQEAFVAHGAVQCGFCTPGFVVAAAALVDEVGAPGPDEVVAGLSGNLCRCTGYRSIVDAVVAAGRETTPAGEVDRS